MRAVVIAGGAGELAGELETLVTLLTSYAPEVGEVTSSTTKRVWGSNKCEQSRIGFLFPGQGSQQLLMARKLVARFEWAREMVAEADRVQLDAGLPTVSESVFADVQSAIDREQATALRASARSNRGGPSRDCDRLDDLLAVSGATRGYSGRVRRAQLGRANRFASGWGLRFQHAVAAGVAAWPCDGEPRRASGCDGSPVLLARDCRGVDRRSSGLCGAGKH